MYATRGSGSRLYAPGGTIPGDLSVTIGGGVFVPPGGTGTALTLDGALCDGPGNAIWFHAVPGTAQ
ncbi:MAG: hypothetical protein WCJ30_25825 [Deltaproteobacteria bacterium]